MITETQVRTSETTGFLRVVREISLTVFIRVITDNLHRVLVSAYRTVGTQTVELSLEHTLTAQGDLFLLRQRSESNVIHDTDRELVLRHRQRQVLEYGQDLSRSRILRTQTITATYDNRSVLLTIEAVFYVQIQRLTVSTRLFRAIQYGDTLSGLRHGSQEMLSGERTIQVNGYQTYLLALSDQVIDSLTSGLRNRTHGDDHTLSVLSSVIIEQTVFTACDLGNLVHIFFYDSGNCLVVRVGRFSVLEEMIRVLGHTASDRSLRVQGTGTELSQGLLVDKRSQVLILQSLDLLDLVRGTETVEEVHERYTRLDRSQVSDTGQVHNLLYGTLGQHGETCLTGRHHVLMVTEDTQRMRSQCTSGYVENARKQFTGDLVHIRDHKQQTLRSSVGCCQGTSLQ